MKTLAACITSMVCVLPASSTAESESLRCPEFLMLDKMARSAYVAGLDEGYGQAVYTVTYIAEKMKPEEPGYEQINSLMVALSYWVKTKKGTLRGEIIDRMEILCNRSDHDYISVPLVWLEAIREVSPFKRESWSFQFPKEKEVPQGEDEGKER